MKDISNSNTLDGSTELDATVQVIDALLRDSGQKKITHKQAYIILEALAGADAVQTQSPEIQTYLDRLFSPKQKDLVFKKLGQEPFAKTEREYYSRVVRKKHVAIAHREINEIATTLTQKKTPPRGES